MTKPYTEDEVRDMFLRYIHALINYWDSIDECPCLHQLRGLAFSILVTLDGESAALPAFKVIPCPHPDDKAYHQSRGEKWFPVEEGPDCETNISGCLHERFHSVVEEEQ